MRIAILTGFDSPAMRRSVEALLTVPGVEIAGIVWDQEQPRFRQRLKNLWRNSQRDGAGYFSFRLGEMLLGYLERRAERVVDSKQVDALLRKAFPGEPFTLRELAAQLGLPLFDVKNINRPESLQVLRNLNADLGVVLGTRILRPATFRIPKLGCINVHKGRLPEFRGAVPGFWEIYEQQPTCGLTIHFIDQGLDTGDIIAQQELPIHPKDTPETLRRKLDDASVSLLVQAVREVAEGSEQRRPQSGPPHKTRPRPTRQQIEELSRRAPHLASLHSRLLPQLLKTLAYLGCYLPGFVGLRRFLRRKSRAAIILYHRLDDGSQDPLTISRRRFAQHLCVLRRWYSVRSTAWLLDRLQNRLPFPPNTVLIHFDDCYASVATLATPLLQAAGFPAAAFVSSGFVDTKRKFPHDAIYFPLDYENLTAAQLRTMKQCGLEIGSHTVNHADMGVATRQEARFELTQSRADLERILEEPVPLFSLPYGGLENSSRDCADIARECEYTAVFSAYGGFVSGDADLYRIPRFGVAQSHRPIDLLLDLEGFGFGRIRGLLRFLKLPRFWGARS